MSPFFTKQTKPQEDNFLAPNSVHAPTHKYVTPAESWVSYWFLFYQSTLAKFEAHLHWWKSCLEEGFAGWSGRTRVRTIPVQTPSTTFHSYSLAGLFISFHSFIITVKWPAMQAFSFPQALPANLLTKPLKDTPYHWGLGSRTPRPQFKTLTTIPNLLMFSMSWILILLN